jgi:CheY-like chemotaxis protein
MLEEQANEPEEQEDDEPRIQVRKPPTIVLAEDDDDLREMISQELQNLGVEVVEIGNGDVLISYLATCEMRRDYPELIITDHRMPGTSGIEVLAGLHQSGWDTPIILITAYADPELKDLADRLGAVAVLEKPIDVEALRAAAKMCVEHIS